MAAVPQRTLNWLYSVLTQNHHDSHRTYHDPNRTYQDVANALAQYPSLFPRTDVYTYENGFSALLLHIVGTLPVSFHGSIYRFPIEFWIPNAYPREPPIVYVSPTQDMAVRVGQHVTLEGRVYHHYLAHWAEAWDKSSLADFLSILRDVFAKEPPVRYQQQPQPQLQAPLPVQRTQQPSLSVAPPPLPPLPPEFGSSMSQTQTIQPVAPVHVSPPPPRPPPKPGQAQPAEQGRFSLGERHVSPPNPPNLPPKNQNPIGQSYEHGMYARDSGQRTSRYAPDRPGTVGSAMASHQVLESLRHVPSPVPSYPAPNAPMGAAFSTVNPTNAGGPGAIPFIPQHAPSGPLRGVLQNTPPQPGPSPQVNYGASPSRPPNQGYQEMPQPSQYSKPPQVAPPSKKETPDLLTSPFELEIPSIAPSGPAPPIPPNPEKDALVHAVLTTVAETIQTNKSQSKSAAESLVSQSRSLHTAIASLQGEIAFLNALNSTLQSNTSILQQSLRRADSVIADAQTRISSPTPAAVLSASGADDAPPHASNGDRGGGLPPIDEVLVAPTVVGKQLYDLVAEERGIQQAIYALQAALVKGVIGVDTWSRHTRGLARDAFLKRALIRKIGKGMGLE